MAQTTRDALADARTLVVNSRPQYGDHLWTALSDGSRAVVAILDGREDLARIHARNAASGAFGAVPGLR